jgi:hypothetical protein
MKTKKIDVYTDPGHGWAKVPKTFLLKILGDKPSSTISHFSYQTIDTVFLEEDNDLSWFVRACQEAGYVLKFVDHHTNKSSTIREYAGYRPDCLVPPNVGDTVTFYNGTQYRIIGFGSHRVLISELGGNSTGYVQKTKYYDYLQK